MTSAIQGAQQAAGAGKAADGIALLTAAGDAGDADALMEHAIWHLTGVHIRRDVPAARALLRRAAAGGHPDAAHMEVSLTANGSGGPADWPAALALLRDAGKRDDVARRHLVLLDAMALTESGAPARLPKGDVLAPGGAVVRFPNLLTRAECEHVARAAADWLEPAVVVDPNTGRAVRHPHRTSHETVIGPTRETLPIRAINLRIAAASGTAVERGEALTVLRYQPGQEYKLHFDSLPGTRNQRAMTMLLYLNEGFVGGETVFPEYGLSVRPKGGDALLFTNTLPDGTADPRARHAGVPVRQGTKWLATRWIRARPFSPWTGPEVA